MRCSARELHPRNIFRISRASRRAVANVFVRIEHEGFTGLGEASPNAYYGETAEQVARKLNGLPDFLRGRKVETPAQIGEIWEEMGELLAPSRAAQCALDVALWDWLARKRGCSVAELALGHRAHAVGSFATVGLSGPEELEAKIAELKGFVRVKVKGGADGDLSAAGRIRAAMPDARIAIDANCAWKGLDLETLGVAVRRLRVEFIEQPLPPENDAQMPLATQALRLPAIADESCVTREDIERMPGHFSGFNIKLVKCGGLTPALRMARRGRELGLKVMVGCMLESSLLIAAGAVAAQLADYADLDGAWLLADDPAQGWRFDRGVLHPPEGPGLGVTLEPF